MKALVPCANIGRFGGFICNFSITDNPGRLPKTYCETRSEGPKIREFPELMFACDALTSMVCRRFKADKPLGATSAMNSLKTFAGSPGAGDRSPRGSRVSLKRPLLVGVNIPIV